MAETLGRSDADSEAQKPRIKVCTHQSKKATSHGTGWVCVKCGYEYVSTIDEDETGVTIDYGSKMVVDDCGAPLSVDEATVAYGSSGSQHEQPQAAPTADQIRERLAKAAAAVTAQKRAHPEQLRPVPAPAPPSSSSGTVPLPPQDKSIVVAGEIPCEAKREDAECVGDAFLHL